MNGTDLCRGNYPLEYSILTKFLLTDSKLKSVTLLNISSETNGLAIVLDLCTDSVHVVFGSSCPTRNITFPLGGRISADGEWHRFALSFSADDVALFVDCRSLQPVHYHQIDLTECRVRPCDEGVHVHVLQPYQEATCSSTTKQVSMVLLVRGRAIEKK